MAKKADQTASFMVRFNQIIFEEDGESKLQWRGKVSHVQGGEDQSFTDFNDAVTFIQERLADLTLEATKDKSQEQQDSLLKKSFSLWKTVAKEGPKVIMETIKDPRKQVSNLQDQISHLSEDLMDKVHIDEWRNASRSDFNSITESISKLADEMKKLNAKVDAISKPSKTSRTPKTTKKTITSKKK
ncbi:MAG: polyhydroxyalkanoate synthesis regulator phasin [Maribacter sp.]|jgi:polyhydroxyalkanoate synthesis regulator phasin|tara:strand:- start:439 stop:996 length:558 start_codon:yes stop_codon:yes gene_type:complete